jgi:hypothetical protein
MTDMPKYQRPTVRLGGFTLRRRPIEVGDFMTVKMWQAPGLYEEFGSIHVSEHRITSIHDDWGDDGMIVAGGHLVPFLEAINGREMRAGQHYNERFLTRTTYSFRSGS